MEPEEPIEIVALEEEAPAKKETLRDWLPFTFRGCAALACGPWWRLFLVELMVAFFVAACCVWLVNKHWCPAIDQAIVELPHDTGTIHKGRLHWPNTVPLELTPLNDRPYLRLIVDPNNSIDHGRVADLQLELRMGHIAVSSVLGFWKINYPTSLSLPMDRERLEPWWGARRPFVLLGLGTSVMLCLLLAWPALALLGTWPVRMVTFFADREGSMGKHWQLATAALMPGAVFFGMGVLCYGLGLLPLLGLLVVWVLHLIVGLGYLFIAPFFLPQMDSQESDNPFADQATQRNEAEEDHPFPKPEPVAAREED
ncbi:MAG: hypothetical protein QF685_03060 [Verrucomicrobiota bacterium]|jgi:hypothetical protein|nr:hypothetical protein [Verrucomicrobiota bacterium]